MPTITRSLLFTAAITILALSVFPVVAQVQPIVAENCGFLGMNCSGAETFLGNISPYIRVITNVAVDLLAVIAMGFLVVAGYLYVTSTGDSDKAEKAKNQIVYALLGLIVAGSAFIVVNAFVARTALPISLYLLLVINLAFTLLGTFAMAAIVFGGYAYITSGGDERKSEQAKNIIAFSVLGLIVAGSAWVVVGAVNARNAQPIIEYLTPYVNVALSLVGIIATIFLIYSGYLYISSTGDEDKSTQARRQIFFALLGIFVAGAAELIVAVVAEQETAYLIVRIRSVVNAILTILGIAAAIYVIIGGVMYITSTGDEDKSSRAKMQIIYAGVGLVVIILSAVAVNLIINAI